MSGTSSRIELLDLGLRDLLVDVAGARLEQQRVAGAQPLGQQGVGDVHDPLLVGVADDERAVAAVQHLLEHDHVAGPLELAGQHDVERLVEHDLLADAAGPRARPRARPPPAACGRR